MLGSLVIWCAFALGHSAVQADTPGAAAWQATQRSGAIILLRHANAPGVGDPPNFKLDDCATQRNLVSN